MGERSKVTDLAARIDELELLAADIEQSSSTTQWAARAREHDNRLGKERVMGGLSGAWILIIVVAAVVGYCTSQAVNSLTHRAFVQRETS